MNLRWPVRANVWRESNKSTDDDKATKKHANGDGLLRREASAVALIRCTFA
jgi:hypothetical protein